MRGSRRAARPAGRRRPGGRRARSCPATAAASSARWRSSRSPAAPSPPTSPATTPSTTPCRSASTCRAPSSTSASRVRVDRMWEAGLVDEVRALEARRAARGPHRLARARLPAGARRTRRGVHRGRGPRRDRAGHQALRAPPGLLVPPRPARALARRRRGTELADRGAGVGRTRRSQPDHVMASGRSGRLPALRAVPSSSFELPCRTSWEGAWRWRPALATTTPGRGRRPGRRTEADAAGSRRRRRASTPVHGDDWAARRPSTGHGLEDPPTPTALDARRAARPRVPPAEDESSASCGPHGGCGSGSSRRSSRLGRLGSLMFAFPLAFEFGDGGPVVAMLGLLLSCCAAGWGLMAARRVGYAWPGLPARGSGERPDWRFVAGYTCWPRCWPCSPSGASPACAEARPRRPAVRYPADGPRTASARTIDAVNSALSGGTARRPGGRTPSSRGTAPRTTS